MSKELTLIDRLKVARATNLDIRLDHASICALLNLISYADHRLQASARDAERAEAMLNTARKRLTAAFLILVAGLAFFVAAFGLVVSGVLQ